MEKDCLLIIFVKNPEIGKVKTRLAKTVGKGKALEVYNDLLQITRENTGGLACHKQVWYSEFIDHNDLFEESGFQKYLQDGDDLGLRMKKAVAKGFDEGFGKVVVIGSDCPDVTPEILCSSFKALTESDTVLGPSADGGYYLLGLNKFIPQIFQGIDWSTPEVLSQTEKVLSSLNYSCSLLPVLNDVDTEEDLKKSKLAYV